jgi:hypothetical protein
MQSVDRKLYAGDRLVTHKDGLHGTKKVDQADITFHI